MKKINVRKMEEKDVTSIIKIEEKSFGKYHWSENSFLAEINNKLAHYFVSFDEENNITGYCGFWNILGEGHITTFAVKEEYRKSKIAEQMMLFLFEKAKFLEIKWFTLEVRENNIPAINLYEKYGFETIGKREKYYQDNNEDALIMWTPDIYSDKLKLLINKNKENLEA